MPCYDYQCPKCKLVQEHYHSIHDNPLIKCDQCKIKMRRLISGGIYVSYNGFKETISECREKDYIKKVKDPERAIKKRKKAFGHEAVGDPKMESDPCHIIKRGKTLGGQQKEVNRDEFIRAAAKDEGMLQAAKKALQKKGFSA